MTADEIEDLAFDGQELPAGLGVAETALFLMFRNLYDYAKRIRMTPEQGRREKQKVLAEFERMRVLEALGVQHRAMRDAAQLRIAEFRKEPSVEAAERIIEAMDGALPREERWI